MVAPAPAADGLRPADPAAVHTLGNESLTLTWQVSTGALKQAVWKQDGTRFFPTAFQGLGAFKGAGFETVREEKTATGTTVIFENRAGDRLAYVVPTRGHVLQVEGVSPRQQGLLAVAAPTS